MLWTPFNAQNGQKVHQTWLRKNRTFRRFASSSGKHVRTVGFNEWSLTKQMSGFVLVAVFLIVFVLLAFCFSLRDVLLWLRMCLFLALLLAVVALLLLLLLLLWFFFFCFLFLTLLVLFELSAGITGITNNQPPFKRVCFSLTRHS